MGDRAHIYTDIKKKISINIYCSSSGKSATPTPPPPSSTHPDQRVLGVADGGEGAEVEDEGELGLFHRQKNGSKSRVLDAGARPVWRLGSVGGLQAGHEAGQGTDHLTQHHFISCLQGWNVLQAQQRLVHTVYGRHHLRSTETHMEYSEY